MDDRDLFNSLSTGRFPSKEASEYFSELRKSAGVKEMVGKGIQTLSNNKAPAIGAVIGAATATALQYMANKPGKDGKSKQRDMAEKSLAGHEKYIGDMKSQGKEPSYPDEMSHARAKSSVETSKVMEKHPLRSSLLAAPGGALAGAGLGLATRKLLGG